MVKNRSCNFFIVVICLFLIKELYPQSFYFLTLPPGIEGNAMGGAQTAIVNDYQAFYYNPAGLSVIKKGLFGFSRISYTFSTFKYTRDFAGVAVKTKEGVLGLSIYLFENIQLSFKQKNYQFSFAKQLNKNLHIGFSVKFLRQTSKSVGVHSYDFVSYSAYTGDVGLLITNLLPNFTIEYSGKNINRFERPCFKGLSFGFALLNTGPDKVNYTNDFSEPVPQILNIGIGYHLFNSDIFNITFALDLSKLLVRIQNNRADNFVEAWFTSWKQKGFDSFHSGLDLNFYHLISLYLGYERFYLIETNDKDGFTFGFALGPDFARLEAFYRIYPTYLPEPDRRKIWRLGFSLAY